MNEQIQCKECKECEFVQIGTEQAHERLCFYCFEEFEAQQMKIWEAEIKHQRLEFEQNLL